MPGKEIQHLTTACKMKMIHIWTSTYKKIGTATQTDTILDLPTKIITIAETKSSSGFDTASTKSSITFDSSSLPFFRLPKSCQKCSICTIYFSNKTHFIEVNNDLRVNCLLDHHIYIQENSRCCTGHFINGKLSQKIIETIKNQKKKKHPITRDEMIKLYQELKEEIRHKEKKLNDLKDQSSLNFDDHEESMSDQNYHVLTGLTRDQFNNLCSYIPSSGLRNSDIRTPRMAIAIRLVKLRLGLSYQALCTLFGLEEQKQISRILDSACSALTQYFVPKHLGFGHITRTTDTKAYTATGPETIGR